MDVHTWCVPEIRRYVLAALGIVAELSGCGYTVLPLTVGAEPEEAEPGGESEAHAFEVREGVLFCPSQDFAKEGLCQQRISRCASVFLSALPGEVSRLKVQEIVTKIGI